MPSRRAISLSDACSRCVAELVITIAPYTAGALRRFTVYVDGREVARLRQGKTFRVKTESGPHVIRAELDHQSGEFALDVDDGHVVEVLIEHAFLVTDSWTDPAAHAFKFKFKFKR